MKAFKHYSSSTSFASP